MMVRLHNRQLRAPARAGPGQDRPTGRRTPTPMRWALPVASLLACAGALPACGSSKSSGEGGSELLSTAQTKGAIEESILKERHLHATVTCPAEVVKEKGTTFQCLAVTSSGTRTTFHVIEVNSRGAVKYSSPPAPPPTAE